MTQSSVHDPHRTITNIEDPCSKRGQRHPLWLVLFLVLLGSLCGYWGYRPLEAFALKHLGATRDSAVPLSCRTQSQSKKLHQQCSTCWISPHR
ncbi:MAG: hypothetical protein HC866_21575 [Leptolyngbyaceae cyanobacterium RU_5_1]|nr:hypothetical protein [Leptolyngbyaceae cyanobacterium RU_5_1]